MGWQNNGANGEAGTSVKKCRRANTEQSVELGMLGSGIRRRPSLSCRVFVQPMRRNPPDSVNMADAGRNKGHDCKSWRAMWERKRRRTTVEELLKAAWCEGHGHGEGVEVDAKEYHRGCRWAVLIGG